MQEDNTYENSNIDDALTAMVDAFSRVTPDLNTLQHGMIAHLYVDAKYDLLGRILRSLNLVDSDHFRMIRDSIEMEYDRRIHEEETNDAMKIDTCECPNTLYCHFYCESGVNQNVGDSQ
jgi:hypothetical protein